MPTYRLTAPNGRTYSMEGPAGLSQQAVIDHVLTLDPDAGKPPPPPQTGIGASFKSGLENLLSSSKAGIKGAFGDTQAAAEEAAAAEKEQGKKYDTQTGLGRIADAYNAPEGGLWAATKEVGAQMPRLLAQSAPQMAATMGGAAAGSRAGAMFGPVGAAIGGVGGGLLANLPSFTGQNLAQQQETTPGQVSYGKALAAGAGQAALEEVAPLALMGTRVASKVFGKDMAGMIARLGPEAAEEVAKQRLSVAAAKGGLQGMLGEGGTEVGQEMLSRLQAGQPLLDNDALKSYAENFYGGALMGAPLGAAGHVNDRSGAKQEVAATEQAALQQAAQEAAKQRAAAEAQAAEAKAARKADPAYAAQVGEQYAAYEAKKKEMQQRIGALRAEKTDAGNAAASDLYQELKAHQEQAKPLLAEFNATRAARDAQAAAAAPLDKGPAPIYKQQDQAFAPEGQSPATYQRIQDLQNQIAEHEALLPQAQDRMLDIMRTGDSRLIGQARAGLALREKEFSDAQKELFKLAPDLAQRKAEDAARAAQATIAQSMDPIKTQKQIDKLTQNLQNVNDPSEAGKAQKWAAERERLQNLLAMREKPAAPEASPYAEDLFQLDERVGQEQEARGKAAQVAGGLAEAAQRGETTQAWPNLDPNAHEPPGVLYSDTPEGKARETESALNATFAPEQRSAMQDIAGTPPAGRAADPLLTQALEEEAGAERSTPPREAAGRGFPGKAPSDLTATGKVSDYGLTEPSGQQRLFVPEAGPAPTADTPRQLLRQRVDKLLGSQGLTGQARARLKQAADILGGSAPNAADIAQPRPKGVSKEVQMAPKTVSKAQLAQIEHMIDQAERGVGRQGTAPSAAKASAAAGKLQAPEERVKPQRLEMETTAGETAHPEAQPDLFHTMHAGRATPANFQRALDTGALPSKRATTPAQAKAHAETAAKAPLPKQRPTLQMQPKTEAHVPTEAQRRTEAINRSPAEYIKRTGENVTRVKARENETGLDITSEAIDDAIDSALAVPGVTQEGLRGVFDRVRGLLKPRAIDTRAGAISKQISQLADDMKQFHAENPGGVIPPNLVARHASAVHSLANLEGRLKEVKSADERARVMDQLDRVQSRIKEFNTKRTALADDPQYREMQRKAAMLDFERDMIEMQRNALKSEEGHTAAEKFAAKVRPAQGKVEPATKMGDQKPATRMVVAKLTKQQKTVYQSKGAPQVEAPANTKPVSAMDSLKAMQAVAAKRAAAETREAAQPGLDMEAEGGRMVPKSVSDAYEKLDQTALSTQNMEHVHDGQLDKVLESLAKTSESPLVRDLAEKLQALTKNTKVRIDENLTNAAEYDPKTDTVLIHPMALTEENTLHEVVHAATLRALVAPESSLTKEQVNARNELQNLLQRVQQDPAFAKEYGRENIAELASELMTNKDLRAKIDAQKPALWTRIKRAVMQMLGLKPQSLSAKAMANVEKLFQPSREFTPAETQALKKMLGKTEVASAARAAPTTALGKFSSMIGAPPAKRGIVDTIKDSNAGLALEQAGVDQRAGILKALSKGDKTKYLQNQYFLRKADARMAQVYSVLQHGALELKRDSQGNHIVEAGGGPSAKDVFKAVGDLPGANAHEKFANAQAYMVAQRAANKGWDKLGWETSEQYRAAGNAMLAEVKADPAVQAKFDAVRKVYNDYNKGMVKFLADSGAISKQLAQDLTKDNDYVPFYRIDNESGAADLVLGEGKNIRIGDVRNQPHLQQLKGDSSKLMPLNEAIMRNTMLLTDMGLSNLATKSVAYSLQDMSHGPDGKTLNPIRSGKAPAGADIIKFKQDGEDRWMRVTSEGTPFEGIPAELLVQSLEGSHLVMTGLGKMASWFGDKLRSGVTRTPAYVIRQLIRDPMSAAFTAGTSRGPVGAMLESMREFVAQNRGGTETGDALIRKGVTHSGIFTGDADDLGKFALQLAHGNESAYTKLISMADRAAMRADAATRSQVYDDALKATGSEMQAELAAIEMMNFTKRGSSPSVQHAARMIPFLNAQIQSLNVLVKAFRGNMPAEEAMQIRSKFMKRALGMAAMSMIYAMGMEDDETYKNATAQDRFSNFFLPTPGGTIKLPIPYEVGLLFKALPEAAARALSDQFDEADSAALRGMFVNTIPGAANYGVVPQAVKPLIETWMNRNMYTGKDIETAAMQKLDPEMRYNENTTEIAKGLSSALHGIISPVKLENLVRGYVGGLPIAAASLANEVFADNTAPDRKGSQTPLLGGFVADPNAGGAVERAYAKAKAIEQAGATYDQLVKEGKTAAAEKYKQDNIEVLMADRLNANFQAGMKRALAARAQVLQNTTLSSAEKRKRIDEIDKFKIQQAGMFTQAAKAIVPAQATAR